MKSLTQIIKLNPIKSTLFFTFLSLSTISCSTNRYSARSSDDVYFTSVPLTDQSNSYPQNSDDLSNNSNQTQDQDQNQNSTVDYSNSSDQGNANNYTVNSDPDDSTNNNTNSSSNRYSDNNGNTFITNN
jgi:hypothetical protein